MINYEMIHHRGKTLMEWAVEWFKLSNDAFYALYGFNFNPHEYPGLYEKAREKVYNLKPAPVRRGRWVWNES